MTDMQIPETDPRLIQARHQVLGEMLHDYYVSGVPMVSVRQVLDILTGRTTVDDYASALQVRPNPGVEWNATS